MKNALLIGGSGSIGLYTAYELLKLSYQVDIISPGDHSSDYPNLTYIKAKVSDELLTELFEEKHYDVIIDFIYYSYAEDWLSGRNELLLKNTDQLIFLSSYRVYADEQHPITESAPRLIDVTHDRMLIESETYAMPKCRCEDWIYASPYKNWTIVRPLISFSHFRLDLVTVPSGILFSRLMDHKKILLPSAARNKVSGVGWAGNVGKLMANLAGKEEALGQTFTLGSGENLTWGQVAGCYSSLFGAEFVWVDTYDDAACSTANDLKAYFDLAFDRLLDRTIDNSHVLEVTGLTMDDMVRVPDALRLEMNNLLTHPEWRNKLLATADPGINAKIDAYLEQNGLN